MKRSLRVVTGATLDGSGTRIIPLKVADESALGKPVTDFRDEIVEERRQLRIRGNQLKADVAGDPKLLASLRDVVR